MEQEKFGLTILSGRSGNPQPLQGQAQACPFFLRSHSQPQPTLSPIPSHNPLPAHSSLNIPNVQVEVNTLPMIQFIQGYFALK